MRDDRPILLDILEAIERIERYAGQGYETFNRDELIQIRIIHNMQIIGEAARKLSESIRLSFRAWHKLPGPCFSSNAKNS